MTKRHRFKYPQGALTKKTRELLIASDVQYLDISIATKLHPAWLSQFANDKIPEPSANKIELLYTFLTGAPLTLG